MGSCFARMIEWELLQRGFSVDSYTEQFARQETENKASGSSDPGMTYLTRYSIFSITNAVRWALDPRTPYPERAFAPLGNGLFVDPYMHLTLSPMDFNGIQARRKRVDDYMQALRGCRIVVITLGLNEVGRDELTGLYINITPTTGMLEQSPGRFVFCVADYEEILSSLKELHVLLSEHCPEGLQIICTVSPVALQATFTGKDVVLANMYSKSVSRAAAEAWVARQDNVTYFPSYEIVQCSHPDVAWQKDMRHPSNTIVKHIAGVFVDHFTEREQEAGKV